MIGTMSKDEFNPNENYEQFYHSHAFEPWPENLVYTAHEVLPRADWALDVALSNKYKTFCDVCCLDGFVALTLAKQAGMEGDGVDLSGPGIKLATKRAEQLELPVIFREIAAEDFTISSKYDMIMMFEAVEHFLDTTKILKKYSKMLKKGGSLLISTPDAEESYGIGNDDAAHLQYYSHRYEEDWGDLPLNWEGRPILSLPTLIEKLGGTVVENEVINKLIHLRATW